MGQRPRVVTSVVAGVAALSLLVSCGQGSGGSPSGALTNLAGAASHAEVLSILRGRLHHWMDSIGEPARTIRPAEPVEPLAPQLRVEPWELPGA